jgi:hypothetical protein
MYLLIREISTYTGQDLLLGVYRTLDEATSARTVYFERIGTCDPWAEQAYRAPSPADVRILADVPEREVATDTRHVFVVSEYGEGCGQIQRSFVAVCGTESVARGLAAAIDANEDQWPHYAGVVEVDVGTLIVDSP